MRQITIIFSIVILSLSFGCRYDDTDLVHRVEQLENRVATIDEQISAINSTIKELKGVDEELEALIANAQDAADGNSEQLQELRDNINTRISELTAYVDREIQESMSWTSATFSTLSQYKKLADDVAALKSAMSNYSSQLDDRILTLEGVMQSWVNSQLAGYYTIAEVDALLVGILQTIDENHTDILAELKSLSVALNTMKTNIIASYEKAIAAAITDNNGVIDAKIQAEISAVNSRIDDEVAIINDRIEALEARIKDLENALDKIRSLDIEFDIDDSCVYMPGSEFEFGYSVINGDDNTVVESFCDGGWYSRVNMVDATTGSISVTTTEKGGEGKVIVIATSGAGGVCMKSIYFDEGLITNIMDSYMADWEACTLDVGLTTNMNYEVRISDDAQSWLSLVDTRAQMRDDILTFTLLENGKEEARSAWVELIYDGIAVRCFEITQKAQPANEPIVFADATVKTICVSRFDTNGDGEVSYKESAKVQSISEDIFGTAANSITSFDEFQYFINVTSIADCLFKGCSNLKSVTLPKSITSIGREAFYGCSALEDLAIPVGVTSIGEYALYGCSKIGTIAIPAGVTAIGNSLLYGCGAIRSITIPEGVATIGNSAFSGCASLYTITIPEGVTSIGKQVFRDCTSLRTVYLPSTLSQIGEWAFSGCGSLISVNIPDGVTSIGSRMFYGCSSLNSLKLPQSISTIGDYAFYRCSSLTSIHIPGKVTMLADNLFYDCSSLQSVYLPTTITTIGKHVFSGCASLQDVYIPEGVTSIGSYAFSNCSSLQTITLPEHISVISEYTFNGCSSLNNVTIPDNVTSIEAYAFNGCSSISEMVIPEGVTVIGTSAFRDCLRIQNMVVPDNVTKIDANAFYNCIALRRVTIGRGVLSVGNSAFAACGSLLEVYCQPLTPPTGDRYMFDRNSDARKIYVPNESVNAYKEAKYWSEYATAIYGSTN